VTPTDRRRRQRAEIEEAAESGDVARALALACEHLSEFPDDNAVVLLATALCSDAEPGYR
jgi:hypothetical protein